MVAWVPMSPMASLRVARAAARAAGCGFIALTTGATLPEEFAPDTELCENLIALRERLEQEGRA